MMSNAVTGYVKAESAGWERTRELYVDWVAEWGRASTIKDEFTCHGFSLWWCSTLVQKDAEVNKTWYEKLHARLNGNLPYAVPNPETAKKIFYFSRLFIADLLKWALIKAVFRYQKIPSGKTIWFHSLASNIKREEGIACDRMFSRAHLLDKEHGVKSGYAITLIPGLRDLLAPLHFKRRTEALFSDIQRDVLVLNGFLRFWDVVKVHASLFANWNKFRRLAKNESFRRGFLIDGIKCDDILIDELENSFLGPFQGALLNAMAFQRWLEKSSFPQVVITYAETAAPLRAIYHFSRIASPASKFVSIQHANFFISKLYLYHRSVEFAQDGLWDGISYSPMPDYYFIQGQHFKRTLEQYYPRDRISIIGSLRYDPYISILAERNKYEAECRSKLGAESAQKIMLIAPSLNDLQDILKIFVGATLPVGWRVIISPHPFLSLESYRRAFSEMQITVPIEFSSGLPTYKLLTIADLVVCGYSAVAFEAAMFDVRSVRIFNDAICPQFDDEPEVPSFSKQENFWSWFNENDQKPKDSHQIGSETDRLVADYFYKIDGKSANRLWAGILPIAQTIS